MTFVFMGGEIDNSRVVWKIKQNHLIGNLFFWMSIFLLCRRMTALIALYILFIQLICAFPRPPIFSFLSLSKPPQPPHSAFNTWPFSPAEPPTPTCSLPSVQASLCSSWTHCKVFYIWSNVCAFTSKHKPSWSRTLPDVSRRNQESNRETQCNARWA